MVKQTHHVVVDCHKITLLELPWIRALMALVVGLKSLNRQCRFVQIPPPVQALFKKQGVDSAFKASMNTRTALVDLGLVTKRAIDMEFINPFIQAAMKVLEVQAQTKGIPGQPFIKKAGEKFSGDISGVIGIVSDAFNGSVVISFPEATFLKIISRIMGSEYTKIDEENISGAGEITNIIFGQAKISLNEKGYALKTALPSVVTGKDHSVKSSVEGVAVVIPFVSDAGKFFVEICTAIDK